MYALMRIDVIIIITNAIAILVIIHVKLPFVCIFKIT